MQQLEHTPDDGSGRAQTPATRKSGPGLVRCRRDRPVVSMDTTPAPTSHRLYSSSPEGEQSWLTVPAGRALTDLPPARAVGTWQNKFRTALSHARSGRLTVTAAASNCVGEPACHVPGMPAWRHLHLSAAAGLRVRAVGYGRRGQLDGGVCVASARFRLPELRRTDAASSGTGCGIRDVCAS